MAAGIGSDPTSPNAREELRSDVYAWLLLALVPLGYLVIVTSETARWPHGVSLSGILLMLLPLLIWLVLRRQRQLGVWILILVYSVVILGMAAWMHAPIVLVLLCLPVLWSTLLVGTTSGLILAGLSTYVVLMGRPLWGTVPPIAKLVTIILIWESMVVTRAVSHFAMEALEQSWTQYGQMARLLAEARDQRLELKQTQADLVHANTELERISMRLAELREAAEQARHAKEEFAANVSHELRTPLNMIIGFSEIVTQAPETYGAELPPNLLADVAVIHRNSQHLASLVNDVLDLSQVEAQPMALHWESCNLMDTAEAAADAVRPLFVAKGLFLHLDADEDLPHVRCDRTRIRQVMLNLLSNAGRFTDSGGVHVSIHKVEKEITVRVHDTGPGISIDDQRRIFEPFRQAGDSILRRRDGSGLGLSVCRRFVELHGGRIGVESELGQGSTFWFALPCAAEPSALAGENLSRWFGMFHPYEPRQRASRAPVPRPKPRLVTVEAGDTLMRLLRHYCVGAEFVQVRTVQEATAELARTPADAVVINDTPSGQSFAENAGLASMPDGTPVITCHIPDMAQMPKQLGVAHCLLKPVTRDQLLQTLGCVVPPASTVLIVDDEPEALQLFARMLSAGGRYRVIRALDGQSALEAARARRPDAILLDLVMPGMSGYDVLQVKKADITIRDIPTIAVTAQDLVRGSTLSQGITIARGGGLSHGDLLRCISGLTNVPLATTNADDPEPAEVPRD